MISDIDIYRLSRPGINSMLSQQTERADLRVVFCHDTFSVNLTILSQQGKQYQTLAASDQQVIAVITENMLVQGYLSFLTSINRASINMDSAAHSF